MTKLISIFITCFIAAITTACINVTHIPQTPLPSPTPTIVLTNSSVITTTGAFVAISVAETQVQTGILKSLD